MDELMAIGAFARVTELSISAVRFYGDRGLLVPARIDDASGYRFYEQGQVATATLIRDLRRIDMPLAEIERVIGLPESTRHALVQSHLRRLESHLESAHTIARRLGATPQPKETTMTATTLPTTDLANALDQVLPAAGTDPERPHLMCVLIEGKAGSVRLVATDSHRLAVRDVVPTGYRGEFSAVVAAATLATWRPQLTGVSDVALGLDGHDFTLHSDALELRCRTVPTEFPDYEPVMAPGDDLTKVVVDRSELIAALESFEGIGAVLISVVDGGITLTRRDEVVDLVARVGGPVARVAVDVSFALGAVRHALGGDLVIEIDGAVRPVIFRSADDGTYTSLLMPVRLD